MIIYTIDAYSKTNENLLFEIEISAQNFEKLAGIMELNGEDKNEFSHGIGIYNISEKQAHLLEELTGEKFYSSELTLQISGGEIELIYDSGGLTSHCRESCCQN